MPATKPISVDFGVDGNKELQKHVENNIMILKNGLRNLHQDKVEKWRKLYKGQPEEEVRSFPWRNASNLVIQVIGENVETLVAYVIGSIYEVMPIYHTGLIGDWTQEAHGREQQEAVEMLMNLVALEPKYLDLYRVESSAVAEAVKYGTVAVKLPWYTDVEAVAVGQSGSKVEFSEFTKYDGPRPEKIEFDRWAATPSAATLEDAPFKYHEVVLTKQQMEERFFNGIFEKGTKKDGVDSPYDVVMKQPDIPTGVDEKQQKKDQDANVNQNQGYSDPKWLAYECWFPYFKDGKKFRIIYTFHLKTKTKLRAIYNFYPQNEEPWELGRLGYTEDGLYGMGYCEMLQHYQEEVSTSHNQRVDRRTLNNTSMLRVDPDRLLDAQFSASPMGILPFRDGEVEVIQLGTEGQGAYEIQSEMHSLGLAKARAGTEDGGMQAPGGSTVNKKGGLSAMGTFSVLQAGNRRRNVRVTDMRYLHLKMGRKFLQQYAEFGIGELGNFFGEKKKYLELALASVKKGRLYLPIRAATASVNKELEKQNDMLLTQVMQRHHMGISQIMQAIQNPAIPPEMKEFLKGWIDSSSIVMDRILRNFNYDDTSRMLPEKTLINNMNKGAANGANQGNAGANGAADGGTPQADQSSAGGNPLLQNSSPS